MTCVRIAKVEREKTGMEVEAGGGGGGGGGGGWK